METTTPAAEVIDADLCCVACNYNLRMQPADGRCPECGAAIRHTLAFPHLSRSAPRWLVSLVDSVTVLLVALAVAFACVVIGFRRDTAYALGAAVVPWGVAWFAVWLLTRPEPGAREFDERAWAWTLRITTTLGYLGLFLGAPLSNLLPHGEILVVLMVALLAPASCLYYNHLRRAANRLPNRRLALQAGAMQLLLPIAVMLALVRAATTNGPPSVTQLLLRVPLVGLGSVGDAWLFFQIFRNRLGLWDWLPLSTAPAAILLPCAAAVLIQFRFAFARAVRVAGGR